MDSNLQEQLTAHSKASSKKKYIWYALLLLVIISFAYYFFILKKDSSNEAVTYNTQNIKRGNLQVTVMATGNLEPTNSVDIGIEVSGTIKEIYVDFNDKVKVGQVLAKLDTTKLKAQVDSSRASLSVARANQKESEVNVKNKKLVYDRTLKMFKQSKGKYPSQNDVDDAKFSYEAAQATYEANKAQVEQAKFNLKTNQDNLAKAVVKSSIDGIVLDRVVEIGQTVAASMSTPTLFTLAKDLTKMQLIVSIDEADVANIKEGLTVLFTVDAYPKETFKGVIKQVRLNPIEESGVITYETVVTVENERLLLRPGMTASARIITKQLKNKLLVPNSALRYQPSKLEEKRRSMSLLPRGPRGNGNRSKDLTKASFKNLYILENSQPRKVRVKVLETDGKFTAIESKELKEDDEVITSQESNNG
ncbi:efflux RND transporter periplasmic adaptor subunit [Halarcobacter anaerophilus]|uniref:Efflux transporter periplasmic adaptor subunit n=1 Tax=Halarcobacter anaerophilus TaxID=877500 RepID=A0A4V1LPU6_9BACT|nr:efflux RND transporter periplasmic adaptor subunit [Halarcobacter anaerophilus]QDF28082.1 RND family efflux system, membrane fusion protein [Halarcobacter anaerophilus]RXJ62428.1 efflux transporter periplasmic adaptor subunit [Halarcobacter anaerophilus]